MDGVCVWFDAARCIFAGPGAGFMAEKDWRRGQVCSPTRDARFVVQEAGMAVCPEPVGPWYAGQTKELDIRNCYCGKDCWMGPYAAAGTGVGKQSHSHFTFRVIEQGGEYNLDPWIVFASASL